MTLGYVCLSTVGGLGSGCLRWFGGSKLGESLAEGLCCFILGDSCEWRLERLRRVPNPRGANKFQVVR